MRKTLLSLAALATVLTSCEPQYKIQGSIANLESEMVYLKEIQDNNPVILDSAKVVDNKFVFEGNTKEIKKCFLFASKEAQRPILEMYLENAPIDITLDANAPEKTVIKGGATQELANQFSALEKELGEAIKPLNDKYMALMPQKETLGDKFEEEVSKIRDEYTELVKVSVQKEKALVEANLKSIVSADVFAKLFNEYTLEEAKTLSEKFTDNAAKAKSLILTKERITTLENVQIGKPAPDFTLATPEGTEFSLSSLKGKMVIIDFWASWCGPCRAENPNVVKIYKEYHPKGLEILSVSLDEKKENWMEAIKKDGLVWNHVSDLKGWSSSAAKLYGVNSIPHIILVNQEGIIVAKNLRGEELVNKLKELIK